MKHRARPVSQGHSYRVAAVYARFDERCNTRGAKLSSSNTVQHNIQYHEKYTRFINHRFITDRGRNNSRAGRQNDCGTGLFFRIANAAPAESLAFSHRSSSCSNVTTSGGVPSASMITTQDKSPSSRVLKPEFVFSSRHKAFLYAALNFREPANSCQ